MNKKVVYFDMDNTLVNFDSGIHQLSDYQKEKYSGRLDEVPGIFAIMNPIDEMVELFNTMSEDERFDCYVLSTSPWENPTAASDKIEWIKNYLPKAYKRVILSHNKHLNVGDYLIDDRTANGAGEFGGELIQYGTDEFPNAESIKNYLGV